MITDTHYQYEKLLGWREEAIRRNSETRRMLVTRTVVRWLLLNQFSCDDEVQISRAGGGRV